MISINERPIPVCFLPHSVTVKRKTEQNGFEYEESIFSLSNVRIEITEKSENHKENEKSTGFGKMFFDCVTSKPSGFVPRINDIVVFGDSVSAVSQVKGAIGKDKIHHYEVTLI